MKKLVIALSGPPGSGASTVGRLLAKRLKLEYFSPGKYFKGLSKKKNETRAAMESLNTEKGRSKELHEYIDNLQIQKAKKGNVLIEGTLSINFLKDIASYKIWLDADISERAARTMKRDGLSLEEAKSKILEREKIERTMWKKIYGFDYFDQKKSADLVVDSSDMRMLQVVDKIFNFIKGNKPFNLKV